MMDSQEKDLETGKMEEVNKVEDTLTEAEGTVEAPAVETQARDSRKDKDPHWS